MGWLARADLHRRLAPLVRTQAQWSGTLEVCTDLMRIDISEEITVHTPSSTPKP